MLLVYGAFRAASNCSVVSMCIMSRSSDFIAHIFLWPRMQRLTYCFLKQKMLGKILICWCLRRRHLIFAYKEHEFSVMQNAHSWQKCSADRVDQSGPAKKSRTHSETVIREQRVRIRWAPLSFLMVMNGKCRDILDQKNNCEHIIPKNQK